MGRNFYYPTIIPIIVHPIIPQLPLHRDFTTTNCALLEFFWGILNDNATARVKTALKIFILCEGCLVMSSLGSKYTERICCC